MVQAINSTPFTVPQPAIARRSGADALESDRLTQRADSLDLSKPARDESDAIDSKRAARIQQLRREIAAGTYLTPTRIDSAVNRLHESLVGR
ncbi:MAG: hypothetical protein U1D55_02015 [Phycisphaerae bacterium]